jgi:hypothetical protein
MQGIRKKSRDILPQMHREDGSKLNWLAKYSDGEFPLVSDGLPHNTRNHH